VTAPLPRLHVITDDRVLGDAGFRERATALLKAHGARVALHIRGHATPGGILFELADGLLPAAETGALLLLNDRVDVALAVGCGAHLGRRSIPLSSARRLLGPDCRLGFSAHSTPEATAALGAGADFVLLGTIWPSGSHPGADALGLAALAGAPAPSIAIGGVTPERARLARRAGAHGVAVLSGIWAAQDPVRAASGYLEAMGDAE
jgi:thiamine-phosphate diphosphorylase